VSSSDRERHIELLVGTRVRARDGTVVGRIEEARAREEGEHYVVVEFDIGPAALLERLSVRHLGIAWPGHAHGYRVRWDQIDLEDGARPRLLCEIADLERLGPGK
jgi:hypothetical protein